MHTSKLLLRVWYTLVLLHLVRTGGGTWLGSDIWAELLPTVEIIPAGLTNTHGLSTFSSRLFESGADLLTCTSLEYSKGITCRSFMFFFFFVS